MQVVKRNGTSTPVSFDKITARISRLVYGLNPVVDPVVVGQRVVAGIYHGVTTKELDVLAAETAAYMSTQHPDFSLLAARIAVSSLHKSTPGSFTEALTQLYQARNAKTGKAEPLIASDVYAIAMAHASTLDAAIQHELDFDYDYFGFKTLERSYLMRMNGAIVERPQYLLMRVALGIHRADIPRVLQTYDLMAQRWFTHATPTMFNACAPRPQLASCFLVQMKEDSIEGIYDTLKTCAQISKSAGGIGLTIHNIRAAGSTITGTHGESNGIVPMLRVFSDTARYVDQGGGKRKGAIAIYMEPWHSDIFEWLDLKKNTGKEEVRARDLFYALWVPDLFMKRVEAGGAWSLMCPSECPGLAEVHGPAFDALYERYEAEGRARSSIKAQDLWQSIISAQVETGTPYMMFKDAANLKSNQQHLGTIQCSNLCAEIVEYTAPDETAVCNLASLNLAKFVMDDGTYDLETLAKVTRVVTHNLNRVIDNTWYPVEEARRSNQRHRPIGLGVQGLADAFMKLRLPFESEAAQKLNKDIFETIYFAACTESVELARREGPYDTFQGSPASEGKLQYDLWGVTPTRTDLDWAGLKAAVVRNGMRNSLLVALMPTASSAQILGGNESFEPITSNLFTRRVLSGEFVVINKYLVKDLIRLGKWTSEVRNMLMAHGGSVQNIHGIPSDMKDLYKTVWETSQKTLMAMSAARGAFVCQSQSFNLHIADPTVAKLTSAHFCAFKLGLKTGMYYLRTRAKANPIQFTVDQKALGELANASAASACSPVADAGAADCQSCGS